MICGAASGVTSGQKQHEQQQHQIVVVVYVCA
jgi:hypothetical protein